MEKTLFALKTIITFNKTGIATIDDIDAQSIEFLEKELKKFADQQTKNCINISIKSLIKSKQIIFDWDRY